MRLTGAPLPLDDVLRPFVRALQLAAGGLGTIALALLGQWWTAPLPLAASFVLYELFFWARRDHPVTVDVGPTIRVHDPRRSLIFDVDVPSVTSAWAVRRRGVDHDDWKLVLADDAGPKLAVWLRVPRGLDDPFPAFDGDLLDRIVGSDFGSLVALAPGDRVARQRIDAPRSALAAFAAVIPREAWERTAVRFWVGAAPPLDLLLHHVGPATGQLRLDGSRWTRTDTGDHGDVDARVVGRSARVVAVFGRGGVEERREPLVALDVGGVVVAARSRILGADTALGPSDAAWLHLHPAEAAALLGHILRETPPERLSDTIAVALDDARAHLRATAAT